MEDPLTSEVLEMMEMAKKHEKEEEATDKPQTVGKELTIPKLREFMQHVTSATQSALQHDPDMECSMQVVEALNQAASRYSQLDQMVMAQQQKKITPFFHPLSSSDVTNPDAKELSSRINEDVLTEWLDVDDNVPTVHHYTDSEIVDMVKSPERNACTGSDEDESSEENEEDVRDRISIDRRYYLKFTMKQMAEAMNKDINMTAAMFCKSYTIKDAITNITLLWKSVPETALNGVWHNLWPQVVHDFKGSDEGEDVKDIMKLVKEVRGDTGFQEIKEEHVTELLLSMEDPLTSEVLEMMEMAKKHEEEEEATGKPQTMGKELTIPKLREFMQHVTSATQSALQHDPDMECSMQVVEALNQAASRYSQLD
ncbi:Tigger transposable element-derived protein 1-like 111 [Homarus americanus]|uniref:Tigger transposable element-derived protein 1-like 111 n=1 Tax=Homarus americanus TaxID=6706 RepID=A0A8J5K4I4_HOMAM|nr:Tigger transposable element-derived protein 1-like 111 [Homarus americanus]